MPNSQIQETKPVSDGFDIVDVQFVRRELSFLLHAPHPVRRNKQRCPDRDEAPEDSVESANRNRSFRELITKTNSMTFAF